VRREPLNRITALCVSRFVEFEKSKFTYAVGCGEKIEAPCIVWIVDSVEGPVVVDTGPPSPAWAQKHHCKMVQGEGDLLETQLKSLGISGTDVSKVVFTHLHWDHCYNLEVFTKACFYVQRRELEYAVAPLPVHGLPYETNMSGVTPPWTTILSRLVVLDGDHQVAPGVEAVLAPGHTPGMQGVRVKTEKGFHFIGSDCFPLYQNIYEEIPPGIYLNLRQWYVSFARIKLQCDVILPGHDMKVLDERTYG
jgi:glyoxylase-like metal-dependent hydrolase (beta-lactamase superfamily II)